MGVIHYEWANTRISASFQVSHGPIGQDFTWSEEMSEWLYQNQAASVHEAVKLQQAPSPVYFGSCSLPLLSLPGKLGH